MAHPTGHGLHQDPYCVPKDGDCGGKDEDAEDEGADWVNDRVLRLEVDYESSSEDSWNKNIVVGLQAIFCSICSVELFLLEKYFKNRT